ncbi:Transcription factor MYB3R-5 [Linum grandiflorum]
MGSLNESSSEFVALALSVCREKNSTMRVQQEEQICASTVGDEPMDVLPFSVYLDCRSIIIPKMVSFHSRATGPTRHSRKGGWTQDEDYLLTKSVHKFKGKRWRKIAECLQGRSVSQCFYRWNRVLNPAIYKGAWTKEEDDCIRELVQVHGLRRWSVIASFIPGRIGKQCRERTYRWHNHLDPVIKTAYWTEEEERILTFYHEIYGNKWAALARYLPGRSENAIKNHWNCITKNKIQTMSAAHGRAVDQPACACTAEGQSTLNRSHSPIEAKPTYRDKTCNRIAIGAGKASWSARDKSSSGLLTLDLKFQCHVSAPKSPCYPSEYAPEAESPIIPRQRNVLGVLNQNISKENSSSTDAFRKHNGQATRGNKVHKVSIAGSRNKKDDLLGQSLACSTPTSHTQGISVLSCKGYNSPESILRNSAKTFRDMPAIIRKRSWRIRTVPAKAAAMDSDCTSEASILRYGQQGFLSLFHKSYPAIVIQSLRRNLNDAFESERVTYTVAASEANNSASSASINNI